MEVSVVKRIVTAEGEDRYCPVVTNNSGRIKSDWIIYKGNQERHAEGSYYLEWLERGRRKRISSARMRPLPSTAGFANSRR